MRPLTVQVERYVLRWRTRRGRATAIRNLDLLSEALRPMGYRFIRLYDPGEFSARAPFLWVYAAGPGRRVGIAVSVLATSGGEWAYHETRRGRYGYLYPCGDAEAAAIRVNDLLKHRMFPGTF